MILFDEEDGLDDTPMFKQRVDEMEASAKRLKDRCAALLAGAKKYRDGITSMLEAQAAFAAALAEFGGGSDEESLHLGSAVMSQFIKVFRELAGFYDFLRTQLDLGLIERVQKDWLEGALAAARDERRKYDRRAYEYDSARVKHQSLKKLTKREVLERSHGDLAAARCAEEEARFDLARRLQEVELSKRYSFLELVVGAVHAHLMFFRNGTDLLGRLESPINDALQIGEHLRQEEVARKRHLEEMIAARKEIADRREALIAREVAALDAGGPPPPGAAPGANGAAPAGGEGGGGAGGGGGAAAVLSAGPGGPVQMSAANAELMADIERLIRVTRTTSGQQVTIIKQGYLSKRSQGKGRSDWKRRFFVLDSNGMMYYYSHKADSLMQLSRSARPKNTLPLLTSTVKLDADDPVVRCAFRVVSPEGTYTLQAETEFERAEWIAALQAVINSLLNGAIDIGSLPRVPVRPTHSRNSSQADASVGASVGPSSADGGTGRGGGAGAGASGGGATPGSSQPGTPQSGAGGLPGIPSGDGSGSDPDAAPGAADGHARAPSRLGGARGGGGGGGSSGTGGGPLERLRVVRGNRRCADCGAQDPDWASLNLGVLLCIECSGVHRQLGVQVSKVRSCTLDVKVWEPQVIAVFEAIGNEASNQIWEARLPSPGAAQAAAAAGAAAAGDPAAAAAVRAADSWVWCEDDSGEDEEGRSSGGGGGGRGQRRSASGRQQQPPAGEPAAAAPAPPPPPAAKPPPGAPLPAKARFIQDKYVARAFAAPLPKEQAQARLWDAVAVSDVPHALAALAGGADPNAAYRTPRAQRLVGDAAARAAAVGGGSGDGRGGSGGGERGGAGSGDGGASSGPGDTTGGGGGQGACGTVTVLHLAASIGDVPMVEYLLQNGAAWQGTDAAGLTALHYAVLFDATDAAKLLMRRAAGAAGGGELQRCRDARGRTPMDLAMAKGRVADEELFLLLSS